MLSTNRTLTSQIDDVTSVSVLTQLMIYNNTRQVHEQYFLWKVQIIVGWCHKLMTSHFDRFDWANIWTKLNLNNIMDAKDKDILFRLYHKILPTRDQLYRMKITNIVECPFCKTDTETVEHLFLYCTRWFNPGYL